MTNINQEEKIRFKTRINLVKDVDERNRLCVLLAWDKGKKVSEIAEVLQLSRDTVYRYIREYKKDSKSSHYPKGGSSGKLDSREEKDLVDHLEKTTYLYVKDICHYVAKEFGTYYSKSGMKCWLKGRGFVYKKPKKVPGKLDPEKQKEFLESYRELKKRLEPGEEIHFVDAVHPQHQSEAICGWIKKGTQKTLQTTGKQLRLHFAGSVCLEGMKSFIQEYETVNAEAMIDFFTKLEKKSKASKLYVILDNARANKNRKLDEFLKTSRIEVVYLPPYSPNLNAIEWLWKVMREKKIYNRYYKSCLDFFREIRGFFQEDIPKIANTLQSRINDNFQIVKLDPISCAFAD